MGTLYGICAALAAALFVYLLCIILLRVNLQRAVLLNIKAPKLQITHLYLTRPPKNLKRKNIFYIYKTRQLIRNPLPTGPCAKEHACEEKVLKFRFSLKVCWQKNIFQFQPTILSHWQKSSRYEFSFRVGAAWRNGKQLILDWTIIDNEIVIIYNISLPCFDS